MKLSQQNYSCVEKAYNCIYNLFAICLYDDFDIDCSTDENGDIAIIAGKFYKWTLTANAYVLFKIKMDFNDAGEIDTLKVTREGVVVGKQKISRDEIVNKI